MSSIQRKPRSEILEASDLDLLKQGISALEFDLSEEQTSQLFQYGQLIQKWNRVYNLTAIRNSRELVTHHLLDSLAVVPQIAVALANTESPKILDVGAGAGLPGLVLAIVRPDWQVRLVDTVQKKAAFMQQAIGSIGLKNAQAIHARVEAYEPDSKFDLICSRAFSSIENFIGLSHHLLSDAGCYAALKGRLEVDNVIPSGWKTEALHRIQVPFLDEDRHLFMIRR